MNLAVQMNLKKKLIVSPPPLQAHSYFDLILFTLTSGWKVKL